MPSLPEVSPMERSIARSRIVLSVIALVAIYIDPTKPTLTRWISLTGGPFKLDPYTRGVLMLHLAYASAVAVALVRGLASVERLATVTMWADVLFGAAIALVTEGTTSPFYVFFAFAVLTAGSRGGFRAASTVTTASVLLYLSLIVISAPHTANFYLMRPAYLAITGYLVGFVGQQRMDLERRVREVEIAAQRQTIARSLHDGYAQALAGVNLRLETCRELLRRGRQDDATHELNELQTGVRREFDELRGYIRSLAERGPDRGVERARPETRFDVQVGVSGPRDAVEHVLNIVLEGVRNTDRHAAAETATISAQLDGDGGRIVLDDDGIGFVDPAIQPWSIASRVTEIGGELQVTRDGRPGAHLVITIPAS